MKMIRSTKRTSINGVTFMSETAPPVEPPPIAIVTLLYSLTESLLANRVLQASEHYAE
jgi:hypothetical protein